MKKLPAREEQVIVTHSAFIRQVVELGREKGRREELERVLKFATDNGWTNLVAAIRSIDHLEMVFSYSYLDAENRGEDDQSRTRLQNRPEHQLKTSFTCSLPWRIVARLDANYVAGQVYYNDLGQQNLNDFVVIDLGIRQPLPWAGLSWQVTITNLLDEDYVQSEDLPQPGRQWSLGLRVNL